VRILLVVHQYPPEQIGGTELYTQSLASYLSRSGHRVSVFCPSTGVTADQREGLDDFRVYRVNVGQRARGRVFLDTFSQRTLSAAFDRVLAVEQPALVHVQHLMGLPLTLFRLLADRGIPYVVTLHDYWFVCANAQLITNYDQTICAGPGALFHNCGRCLLARAGSPVTRVVGLAPAPVLALRSRSLAAVLAGARRLIAPSRFVADTYRRLGPAGSNIVVVPHGIAAPESPPGETAARPHRDYLQIGYLGNLAWQKGVHCLIEAVNRLPENGARLEIYGGQESFPEYVAELHRLALHPGITFHGSLSRRELWPALAQLDVLVVPSLWHETSSLVVQEAFACRVPVVASSAGALPEKIHHGHDGLLVPPGDISALRDALSELMVEPARLAAMRQNIAPVQTLDDHGREVEAVYARALGLPVPDL
jgi:glycosyltransferase involved in cell wall biosynthesis